jgi:hypothetical protein
MEDTGDAEAGEPRMNAKGREFNHNHGLNARATPEGRYVVGGEGRFLSGIRATLSTR